MAGIKRQQPDRSITVPCEREVATMIFKTLPIALVINVAKMLRVKKSYGIKLHLSSVVIICPRKSYGIKSHLSDDGDIFHMEGLASMLPQGDTRTAVDLIIWIRITILPFHNGDCLDLLMITTVYLVKSLLGANSNVFGSPLLYCIACSKRVLLKTVAQSRESEYLENIQTIFDL